MKKMKLTYVLLGIALAISSCKRALNETPIIEQQLMVSSFAGADGAAFSEGTGEVAAFNRPTSIAIDASGNIFVADRINARIRKVTPSGQVSTFIGNGAAGYKDGTGTDAQIGDGMNAITIDAQNNLYLADKNNSCIRKITPTGVVTTLVGLPGRSSLDGPIATAGIEFSAQPDITVDASNNIYFNDDKKGIRKVSANGVVSTVVINGSSSIIGPIATARIANPVNLCTDKNGNIYVASIAQSNNVIFKISTDNIVSVYAGALGDAGGLGYQLGLAPIARFNRTRGMSSDKSGNILIVDNNHVVVKITPDGFVRLVAGIQYSTGAQPFIPGPALQARLTDVIDVATDPNGIIYTVDDVYSTIRKIALVDKPTTPPTQAEIEKANWNKPNGWK